MSHGPIRSIEQFKRVYLPKLYAREQEEKRQRGKTLAEQIAESVNKGTKRTP